MKRFLTIVAVILLTAGVCFAGATSTTVVGGSPVDQITSTSGGIDSYNYQQYTQSSGGVTKVYQGVQSGANGSATVTTVYSNGTVTKQSVGSYTITRPGVNGSISGSSSSATIRTGR